MTEDELEQGDLPASVRLQVYREEVRGNIEAFSSALSSMWKAILVLLLVATLGVVGSIWNRQEILNSRENGYKGRMVLCLSVLVDNDREFAMPTQCLSKKVLVYYPDEVCSDLDLPDGCGSRNEES